MKTRSMVVAIAAAAGLFITGAVAQHEEHHNDQAAPPAGQTDSSKTGGMMSCDMMAKMPQMMTGQNETAKLVDQLVPSFAAIEAEKDSATLQAKLAAHAALLKDLQAKVQAQSRRMEMMHQMMLSMMGGTKDGQHK